VNLGDDVTDLRNKLMPAERHLINRLVAFFATGDSIVANNLVLNNSAVTMGGSASMTFTGTVAVNGTTNTLNVSNSSLTQLTGSVGGAGGLTVVGTGVLALTSTGVTSNFSGFVTVDKGVVLNAQSVNALGSASGVLVTSGGTLQIQTSGNIARPLTISGTLSSRR
jgi:hypothetical protein